MFEDGVLPRDPAGGAVGVLGVPTGVPTSAPVTSSEDVVGLLASLAAGGELAGVVEGLLARLLVRGRTTTAARTLMLTALAALIVRACSLVSLGAMRP